MIKLDTSWVEDASISAIDNASTKDEVREVWEKTSKKRDRNYKILLKLDGRFADARAKGDALNEIKYHLLFMKRAEILKYYDDELNRLIKLYGDKSGHPVFIHGENGNAIWKEGEEIAIDDDTMEMLYKKIESAVEKVRRRKNFRVVK